jgi:hypothetical protein
VYILSVETCVFCLGTGHLTFRGVFVFSVNENNFVTRNNIQIYLALTLKIRFIFQFVPNISRGKCFIDSLFLCFKYGDTNFVTRKQVKGLFPYQFVKEYNISSSPIFFRENKSDLSTSIFNVQIVVHFVNIPISYTFHTNWVFLHKSWSVD